MEKRTEEMYWSTPVSGAKLHTRMMDDCAHVSYFSYNNTKAMLSVDVLL